VRDRTAERPKKVLEGSRFRRFSRGQQSEDRQPDDNCAERLFHNNDGYLPLRMKNASFSATFSASPTRTVLRSLSFPLTPDFAGFRIHEMTAPHFVNVSVWVKVIRFIQSPAKLFGE